MIRPAARPATVHTAWIAAGLVALTVIVFANVSTFDFVSYDDPWYITDNPDVTVGLTWRGIWWALTSGYLFYWQPVTWLSHMVDVQVFGLWAGGHHLTNLLLHTANVLVLFGVLRSATQSTWRSAVVAALFAVHPVHVESVAWVAERKDVLSTLFLLLTLRAYMAWVADRTTRRYLAVAGWFALGLMAKPMLVTLPFLLLLLDVWPLGRLSPASTRAGVRAIVTEKLPLFALAAVVGLVTIVVQRDVGAVGTLAQLPVEFRVANATLSYVRYASQTVWPSGLAVFYPYPPTLPPWWQVAGAGVALIGVTLSTARAASRRPYLLMGWLWYVIALLPVIGLVQAGDQLMADRFTYVPLIGLFIIVVWGVSDLVEPRVRLRRAAIVFACVLIGIAAAASRQQLQYWRDSESLWRRALAVTSGNHRAHAALGEVLDRQGRTDDAIDEYRAALRIVPGQAEWRNNLGLLYARADRVAEAMGQFAIATRIRPGFVNAHTNLGAMQARAGQMEAAIASYTEAIRLDPGHALAHGNLARAYASEGRLIDAARECQLAITLEPANDEWRQLAAILAQRAGKEE